MNISQLQSSYETLSENQDEVKRLKDKIKGVERHEEKCCPEGWKRFRFSWYFKSNEKKTWYESRSDCQSKGADLVIINNEEEQKCVTELNKDGDSWIGLQATEWTQTGSKWKWKWVDDSPLTLEFWATGHPHSNKYAAAFCNKQGKWTSGYNKKNWICEKELSCLS
ncbi:CD209 antigen-like protein A [Micropterus dolomieu]|uniref:CD209 antigen-like protein A n=1 Tax=Micropterus dolomieu TaxID=147949 RepID=UPI001E8D67E0|nr:CD209 antigen-like protein A [Micropterus dolomieu]